MQKLLMITVMTYGLLILTGCTGGNSISNKTSRTCKDVTSYDHNRDNDMKCISSNGDVKYTSYEGARVLESL